MVTTYIIIKVTGVLKGSDGLMNLVLDDVEESISGALPNLYGPPIF